MATEGALTQLEGALTQLAETIGQLLTQMVEAGGKFPIRTVCVSCNGSMLYTRLDGPGELQVQLAEHIVEPGFALPLNLMFVDADGNALRAVIELDQDTVASRFVH